MRRLIAGFLLLIATPCYAGINAIEEQDGSPSLFPWKVKVSNGSLTDNGDGTASLTTGGGGGGMAIGGAITSGTQGSVLFVGPATVLSQDNTTLFFDDTLNQFTVTSGNATASNSFSGGANLYGGFGIGRTAQEGGFYIAGGANQFSTGAIAGDMTVRADNTTGKLFLGSGPTAYLTIKDIFGTIGSPITSNVKLSVSADAVGVTDIFRAVSRDSTVVFNVTRNKFVTAPGTGSLSEHWGDGAVASNTSATAVGNTTVASGSNSTVVGQGSTSSVGNSVAIGQGISLTNSSGQTIVGYTGSAGGQFGIAIGNAANAQQSSCIAIGKDTIAGGGNSGDNRCTIVGTSAFAASNQNNSTGLGYGVLSQFTGSVAIGSSTATTATGQFVSGSSGFPITDVYFGQGVNNASATAYDIHGTAGVGTNKVGGGLNIDGGQGTGLSDGGVINFKVSPAGTTGSSANALVTAMSISSDGTITATLPANKKLRVLGATNIGWTVATGANTACNTTCSTIGSAIVGFDTGTLGVSLSHIVGPADATADECLCGS